MGNFQGNRRVVQYRAPGHQQIALRHVAADAQQLTGRRVGYAQASAGRRVQAGQQSEHGRLPATAWPNQADKFAFRHAERDIVESKQG